MMCARCRSTVPDAIGACPACLLDGPSEPVMLGGALALEDELGRGGMGTVHRARHLKLGRTVAVKFLPDEFKNDPEFRARFEREARALAMLNHPNIVAVHDFGEHDGECYLVMEYVPGGSLATRIPMPPAQALPILLQVCDALSCAHQRGIVHRDIKPDNILLDGDRVKVSDFGIARILRQPGVTASHIAVGTPAYLAPEAKAGAPPDPRQDVFALGAMLYELITGHTPDGALDPLPPALDAVVRRALAHDPAKRYTGADEMKRDLEAAMTAAGESLPPDEVVFVRGVAMLQSISTAVALWALLQCLTPKVIDPAETNPLLSIANEPLPDGRIVSHARFEMWWTMAALATFAIAITSYGFLRRHWRQAGLERREPDRPVREATWVWVTAVVAIVVYGLRRLLQWQGHEAAARYIPVLGAAILIAALFFFWCSVLEAWRTSRPLRREPLMWLGCVLCVLPPVIEFLRHLRAWRA
jgi:serine/threonine-protein kinase